MKIWFGAGYKIKSLEKHKKIYRRNKTSRIVFQQFEYEMPSSLFKKPPPNNMDMILCLGSKFCVQTKKTG